MQESHKSKMANEEERVETIQRRVNSSNGYKKVGNYHRKKLSEEK